MQKEAFFSSKDTLTIPNLSTTLYNDLTSKLFIMKSIDYNLHGWLVLNKPVGPTSFDVIRQLRRLYPKIKCGHAGTLDPLACGVLPLALGEATKVLPWLVDRSKSYRFIIKWGEQRTTDDCEGEIIQRSDHRPTAEDIQTLLPQFIGTTQQIPPAYSAIKIQGKRACDRMRNSETVELSARPVFIKELQLLRCIDNNHTEFHVVCSKGTYVRSLARDMAQALGTLGHTVMIERTRIGPFQINRTISLETLAIYTKMGVLEKDIQPLDTVLDDILVVSGDILTCHPLRQGQSIPFEYFDVCRGTSQSFDTVFVKDKKQKPIAITVYRDGRLWPKTVFNIEQ